MIWNFIGTIATILTSIQLIPQVIKVLRTRSVKDISLGTFIIMFLAGSLWLIYGIHVKDFFIIITNCLVVLSSLMIIFFKFKKPIL